MSSNLAKDGVLKAKNCRSTAAFILYLQSVINSQLSNLTRSLETNCEHVPVGDCWENPDAVEPVDLADLLRLIERRDLKAVLFARLRQWAADHAGSCGSSTTGNSTSRPATGSATAASIRTSCTASA